jgi:3-oxoacyl-[acyl-carrier-protein] synthase II
MRYGFQGPAETVCTACAAATHAIGNAARQIAWGMCDAVITGGSESAGTVTAIAGFANMTAISSTLRSMPFDQARDGFVMGEGSAVFVLERMDLAQQRGARIIAEVLGAASNADAHHITAPSPGGTGAARCMHLALEDAGLTPNEIKQINAHGTSTPLNDQAESQAIATVFGNHQTPVVSIKGVTGHPLGAAGALEAASVLLSFEKRLIPPTRGTSTVDPEMNIDLVVGDPREWIPGPTISNNFGFGGHNGSIVLSPL